MDEKVRQALQAYAANVIDDARYHMAADKINATGTLSKSLRYWVTETRTGYTITFGANPPADRYARWAEEGRGPGRWPPREAIARWIMAKPGFKLRGPGGRFIQKTMRNALRAAYPIARAIGRRGTKLKADGRRGARMFEKAAQDNRSELAEIEDAFAAQVRSIIRSPKPYRR